MIRSATAIVWVTLLAATASAATFFTDTAQFAAQATLAPPGLGGPPLDMVSIGSLSDAGRLFQNTIDPGGATVVGNRTNAVGALVVDTAKVGGALGGANYSGILSAGGKQMVAIFGVQGVVTDPSSPGNGFSAVQFTAGHLQIVEIDQGTFAQNNVATWGFQSDLTNPAVLATYVLKPQEDVVPGTFIHPSVDSEPKLVPANQTNIAAGNLAIGADLQSTVLLEEDPRTGSVPPGSQDLLNSDSTLAAFLTLFGFDILNEAIFADLAEEVIGLTESILDGTEQDILDAIAMFGFGEVFANFGAGNATDFTVIFDDLQGTADFVTDIGGNFTPGLQAQLIVEPEPASVLAWSVVCLVGGGFFWGCSSRRTSLPRQISKA